ncbi:hypothetical protein LPJ77_002738 [Coemansia sp. RSA 2523]|nr:hypothetical protein LPJ77_002738 [Coemansia sp. RSA 2523]KAJ2205012.1 hypothetical protein IW145_003063 [Coemansia sp. RSA 521]KAJ2283051.1 hypothetical protein GGH14_001163 [Coemansia sp. RSA 370]KAJ2434346.1 hypothetical protein IWW41_001527 [Coemansia sp. RSA 2522]KAJ2438372.1 hypothetical protein IWW46_004920 [Coemansia sp. RSA 2440]
MIPLEGDEPVKRATFIGLHERTPMASILYCSSGVRPALGYTPASLASQEKRLTVADTFGLQQYSRIFTHNDDEDEEVSFDDEASIFTMYIYLNDHNEHPVLCRVTSFKTDTCVLAVVTTFPEVPFVSRPEIEVEILDRKMAQEDASRQEAAKTAVKKGRSGRRSRDRSTFVVKNKRAKVAFVLEHPHVTTIETEETGRRPNSSVIAFATGSISSLLDVDTSDVAQIPFLKLIAPEDILHVSRYFERLSDATDVQFETFRFMQRPQIIAGDIAVADENNSRVLVEALGAAVEDGVVLLVRKVRVEPAPTRDTLGNFVRPRDHDFDDADFMSLADIISSDPGTSDAGDGWSELR